MITTTAHSTTGRGILWLGLATLTVLGGGLSGPARADLIAHYRFDEGVGTTAVDGTVNGLDGTLVNMEANDFVPGFIGFNALSFDGADERVTSNVVPPTYSLPTQFASIGSGDFSFSAWINSTSLKGNIIAIGGDFGSSATSNHGIALLTQGLSLGNGRDAPATGQVTALFGTPVNTGEWTHVVGVRDAGVLRVYRNGVEVGTTLFPAGVDVSGSSLGGSARQLTIGLALKPTDQSIKYPFAGLIDDVGIFDEALSPSEVELIYESGLVGADLQNLIPEPSSVMLLGLATFILAWRRRRYR